MMSKIKLGNLLAAALLPTLVCCNNSNDDSAQSLLRLAGSNSIDFPTANQEFVLGINLSLGRAPYGQLYGPGGLGGGDPFLSILSPSNETLWSFPCHSGIEDSWDCEDRSTFSFYTQDGPRPTGTYTLVARFPDGPDGPETMRVPFVLTSRNEVGVRDGEDFRWGIENEQIFTISGSSTQEGKNIWVFLTPSIGGEPVVQCLTQTDQLLRWKCDPLDIRTVPQGEYRLTARFDDNGDHQMDASDPIVERTIHISEIPNRITAPVTGQKLSRTARIPDIQFKGTASPFAITNASQIQISVQGPEGFTQQSTASAAPHSFDGTWYGSRLLFFNEVPLGDYTVTATFIDNQGNILNQHTVDFEVVATVVYAPLILN